MFGLLSSFLWAPILLAATAQAQQFGQYRQIQERACEKVHVFMQEPVDTLKLFHDFFDFGGFPNKLQALDRDLAVKYMYSLVSVDERLKPFYGLENGLCLGYFYNDLNQVPKLIYREPGNSGFAQTDPDLGIYWDTCVDAKTGSQESCQMVDGELYIACQDGCPLVPCQDLEEPDQHETEHNVSGKDKFVNITWCRNYTIQTFQTAGSTPPGSGYVPLSNTCINATGAFSQTPGEILLETPKGVRYGDCTFESGALVNRTNSGPFANCANEPSKECDTTYIGGYESRNYDPRWRGWYIAARKENRPLFSDPYLFFGTGGIGMTYTHPIHQTDGYGREVLYGVLAVDMTLDEVSGFLIETVGASRYDIAVYEARDPQHMLGVSTGSNVTAQVLKEDNTVTCSQDQIDNDECELVQLTIRNFGSSQDYYVCPDIDECTEEDMWKEEDDIKRKRKDVVLRKAHEKYQEMGYSDTCTCGNEEEDIDQDCNVPPVGPLRENDNDLKGTPYVAIAQVYEQPGANLKWRIIVISPIKKDSEQQIVQGETLFAFMIVISLSGFAICFTLFMMYFRQRNERAVQFGDFQFTGAFILGAALMNLTSLTYLGENTDQRCLLRMWAPNLVYAVAISPLFIKAFRAWRLLGTPVAIATKAKLSNAHAWLLTLPIPTLQTIILLVLTFVDPPKSVEDIDLQTDPPSLSITCQAETNAYDITQVVFDACILVTGCILAYLQRNIDPRFGDARGLLFAMYNLFFTYVMMASILNFVDLAFEAKHTLRAIAAWWVSVFDSIAFVVPRLMAAKEDRKQHAKKMAKLRSQHTRRMSGRRYSSTDSAAELLDEDESLKILVCTANIGNASPNLESMRAWIPERGSCALVEPLEDEEIDADQFDIIVIGMQEATWVTKDKKGKKDKKGSSQEVTVEQPDPSHSDLEEDEVGCQDTYLAAVEGEDTVAMRKMVRTVLGEQYTSIREEIRGQMRMHIWALKDDVAPFIEDLKVSGANTGIGNVMANKGGIVVSMTYHKTRLTFLTAHLAAHEGESYYQARCENVQDILKISKTFELSKEIDVAISSHHMFVMGDLNFRTKFDEELEHEESVNRALELVEAKDWEALYGFDELHKGVRDGHLLVNFNTLPCNFNPTFKMQREPGFVYKKQRTPSYTDRILYKSAPGLATTLKQTAYEPCVDFITSDHKPVRGAFSIVPNDEFESMPIPGKFRVVISEIECQDLLAGDLDGFSDPYVVFMWDAIDMTACKRRWWYSWVYGKQDWPMTSHKSKTLNPTWPGKEIMMDTTGGEARLESMLYVNVYDYDFLGDDEILGTLPLNLHEIFLMKGDQSEKELVFDRQLERFGKFHGRIKFKMNVFSLCG